MRKKNKLYTANRWNQPLFAGNIFEDGGNLLGFDRVASKAYGANYGNDGYTLNDYMSSKNAFGISKADNPFSKGNLNNVFSSAGAGSLLKGAAGAIGSAVGNIGGKLISGGLNSGAGSAISNVGGAVGGALGTVNPLLGGVVSAASGIIGGGVNALFGTKVNQERLNAANEGTNYLNGFKSDATSFDGIQGPNAVSSVQDAYKGGVFKKGWARKKNAELQAQRTAAESWANRSVDNNIDNIADTQMDNLMANYAAFGGPLGNSGAIDYGFMTDYFTTKNKAIGVKDKMNNNIFGSLASPTFFALGGDMQTNGGDFPTGLVSINAGKSHTENPYGGVQVGISRENGEPNLVEEGETIFDDYVFSKRLKADAKTKKKFHVGKNTEISYADLSKKLEKESVERANDPISQNGLTKQLHELAEEQERQKSEQQAKQAQDMFNSLPPEQQAEIMQQMAMQEQAPQQEETMQEPPMLNPQEQQVSEEPMQGEQIQQPQMEEQPMEGQQMNACGGKINRYDVGGDMKTRIYKALSPYVQGGIHTDDDFNGWLSEHKLPMVDDWDNILKNGEFVQAVKDINPALADAISRGYDFGAYVPNTNNKLTFDFKHGGWGTEDYNAWNGSTDAAWQEAVKKGLVKEGMNSEEIGKALSQTDAYRRGSDWLKSSEDNRLAYLQQILNSQDAPQAARDYAAKYVDSNGWLKDAKRDYQTIFEDPNGTGVRNTHPGTYWKTPNEILRGDEITNYEQRADGSIVPIIGDVPKDWKNVGSYDWQDEKANHGVRYYTRPIVANTENEGNSNDIAPKHKPTWGRYMGLFGPAVGLGLQAAGVGKPDYSRLDASVEAASGAPALAHYKPIGDYLTYNPMDIWYEQNRMNANSRATDRAILNSSSPLGTKTAGLLANGYNSQLASGNLYRQALEYNDAQRQKVAEFNRGTNMYNADAFTKTSATNAELQNRNRQFKAQMAMDAARQRMAADAAWNQGIYGNVQGLFKGLSDWGKENEQHNMIADMAADSLFGVGSGDKQYTFRKYTKKTNKKSCGGKLNRRRGLTF